MLSIILVLSPLSLLINFIDDFAIITIIINYFMIIASVEFDIFRFF